VPLFVVLVILPMMIQAPSVLAPVSTEPITPITGWGANIEAGGTVYGNYDCRRIDFSNGWISYNCGCSNLFPGYTCDEVLKEAGFEIVQSANIGAKSRPA
jgi:hypothetical protein